MDELTPTPTTVDRYSIYSLMRWLEYGWIGFNDDITDRAKILMQIVGQVEDNGFAVIPAENSVTGDELKTIFSSTSLNAEEKNACCGGTCDVC